MATAPAAHPDMALASSLPSAALAVFFANWKNFREYTSISTSGNTRGLWKEDTGRRGTDIISHFFLWWKAALLASVLISRGMEAWRWCNCWGLPSPGESLVSVHGPCPAWGGQLQPRRGQGLPTNQRFRWGYSGLRWGLQGGSHQRSVAPGSEGITRSRWSAVRWNPGKPILQPKPLPVWISYKPYSSSRSSLAMVTISSWKKKWLFCILR